jgi:hydrogenase maturation protease
MPPAISALVIGYGNDLRGDDAVGRVVADRVRAWGLPHVRIRSLHQLTPDLAQEVAAAGRVLFIDAHPSALCPTLRIQPLAPAAPAAAVGHAGDPQAVLAWSQTLYGAAPEAWWITLPAERFDFGAPLAPLARDAIPDALQAIRRLLDGRPLSGPPRSGGLAADR